MSELIDTTEMYLRTVYELIEEGITPMRARIAERLHQSGPTVSQTVARMERDGLLAVHDDRRIELSSEGLRLAEDVMRKHRLAERLLIDVIGLDWVAAHDEACRWEHVVSDQVERRLLAMLDVPTHSPYGNPIPGLARLGYDAPTEPFRGDTSSLAELATDDDRRIVLVRMSEFAQSMPRALAALAAAGVKPGTEAMLRATPLGVRLVGELGGADLSFDVAEHLYGRLA